jgi:glycine/serine hydroxymethyltransferase
MKEAQAAQIGSLIAQILRSPTDASVQTRVRGGVKELTTQHPVW